MRVVVQRVQAAAVAINGIARASIEKGLLIFAGFEASDDQSDLDWMSRKLVQLRIFDDANQVPNLSVQDIHGDVLLVSQFTLHAATKKGNRPSYIRAARPEQALPLYTSFIRRLEFELGKPIQTGTFGADMQVTLHNDGPVTIWIDSKNKE